MHQIRLQSPFREQLTVGEFIFSNNIPLDSAEALLCEWAPNEEILSFKGPKAWYHNEAACRKLFDDPKWQQFKVENSGKHLFAPSHPNCAYRIPMITHIGKLNKLDTQPRIKKAIAIFSNTGLNFSDKSEINLRNQFILHSKTDLYGRSENWEKYMKTVYNKNCLPVQYKGEIDGNWSSQQKIKYMSQYKVAICLENILEDYYFTEKFVAAAQSGCIPIYHAHETIKYGILSDARWVDPADFSFNVSETINFALSSDQNEYSKINYKWLEKEEVINTGLEKIFMRMGNILINKHG
jgi:hypothetical protein